MFTFRMLSSAVAMGLLLTGSTVWADDSHPQHTPHMQATGVVAQVTSMNTGGRSP